MIGISEAAICKWIKAAGATAPDETDDAKARNIITIDEMWRYVDGKKILFSSGKPLILYKAKSSPDIWVGVLTAQPKDPEQAA